jgi:DnaK suppressor protein
MPKKTFSEFRSQLQSQRQQLLGEVREKIAASGEGLGFANQSKVTDDDAIAGAAADLDVAMVVRESQELQNIEAALARIADGSYGNCADCDSEIARPRLKAYPMATRCLACQEKYERLYGQAHKVSL